MKILRNEYIQSKSFLTVISTELGIFYNTHVHLKLEDVMNITCAPHVILYITHSKESS